MMKEEIGQGSRAEQSSRARPPSMDGSDLQAGAVSRGGRLGWMDFSHPMDDLTHLVGGGRSKQIQSPGPCPVLSCPVLHEAAPLR